MLDKILSQSKFILVIMVFLFITGIATFYSIPKESNPDVKVPIIYVSVTMRGISAADGERLMLRPIEKRLKGISNVKKISSRAVNGYVSISVEFDAGFDVKTALTRVKDKVDEAKSSLPPGSEVPVIKEIDFSKFPVLNVILYGDFDEKTLIESGRILKRRIEMIPNVLEVNVIGDRKDLLEIFTNPGALLRHKISGDELISIVDGGNRLISGGFLENSKFSGSINVDSVLQTVEDVKNMPILARDLDILRIKDIGYVNKSFIEMQSIARVNGKPAVVLEISKRYGTNIINTIESVKSVVESMKDVIQPGINIDFMRDQSDNIKESLSDLGNNVLFAVILVLIVVMSQIGKKQGFIVGMSVPISFFIGVMMIGSLGYTMNIVVLFALILASGMIVDASVIVAEYADRLIISGEKPGIAYAKAASRMSIPVLSATIGIIIVYLPLLFWPGIIGQFMKFIPITIIWVLLASIISALVFIPILGSFFKKNEQNAEQHAKLKEFLEVSESGNLQTLQGFYGFYLRLLNKALDHPKRFILFTILGFFASIVIFKQFGAGVEFFPVIDAKNIQVVVRSGGNISPTDKFKMMQKAEERLLEISDDFKVIYAKVFGNSGVQNGQYSDDTIGVIDLELQDWHVRENSDIIAGKITEKFRDFPGARLEILQERGGPRSGDKKIQIEITSSYQDKAIDVMQEIFAILEADLQLVDLSNSLPSAKMKWNFDFNRAIALKYGVNTEAFGSVIKLCTNGARISAFRPDYSDDTVDIVMKIPQKYCSVQNIAELPIYTKMGTVSVGRLAKITPINDLYIIQKINGNVAFSISSNVANGVNVSEKIAEIKAKIKHFEANKDVNVQFAGEDMDKQETGSFLMRAFSVAIFLKIAILIAQFNSIYYSLIVMSAVILSIIGVLIGLVLTGKSFGIVMCGLGIISLAGIVVSNNIILIDTYQRIATTGADLRNAILRTCVQRLRPILMTSATTFSGLVPMMFNFSIDFFDMKIVYNSPSGQWWEQLSTTIGGGLFFATIFTLFFTPCCLMLHTPEIHVKKPPILLRILSKFNIKKT